MWDSRSAIVAKGAEKERQISCYHSDKTAVLASSLLLRKLGAGQVDFCYIQNSCLHLLEVKSSWLGVKACQGGSRGRSSQFSRLRDSGEFLSQVTGLPCQIEIV